MKDQRIICIQCENTFVVTADQKERLFVKGFNIPRRCPECRRKKNKLGFVSENKKGRDKRKHDKKRYDIDFE